MLYNLSQIKKAKTMAKQISQGVQFSAYEIKPLKKLIDGYLINIKNNCNNYLDNNPSHYSGNNNKQPSEL